MLVHRMPTVVLCLATLQALSAYQPVTPPAGGRGQACSAESQPQQDGVSKLAVATAPAGRSLAAPAPIQWPSTGPPVPGSPRGPSEFELNLGRVIDVLRTDYPNFFTQEPDLSIYTDDIAVHDPSGERLHGRKQYRSVFQMMRFLRRTTMQDAEITYRLVVTDRTIRVRWSAKMWMRDPALGINHVNGQPALVHLDGVSSYDLNDEGLVKAHRLDNIELSGRDRKQMVNLQFAWPTPAMAMPELAVPFFRALSTALPADSVAGRAAKFEADRAFALSGFDSTPTPKNREKETKGGNILGFVQTCETSYDCESPQVCCDLFFGKICCGGGLMIPANPQPVPIPIPIPVERDPYPSPPQYPGGYPY